MTSHMKNSDNNFDLSSPRSCETKIVRILDNRGIRFTTKVFYYNQTRNPF